MEGPVTAGRLAELTGLTTGAITTVLDRLEKAGLPACRARELHDRRRVLVEDAPRRARRGRLYREHMAQAERITSATRSSRSNCCSSSSAEPRAQRAGCRAAGGAERGWGAEPGDRRDARIKLLGGGARTALAGPAQATRSGPSGERSCSGGGRAPAPAHVHRHHVRDRRAGERRRPVRESSRSQRELLPGASTR